MNDARKKLESAIAELGLTVESTFIPFSQSRNKGEKHPSLNWTVQLLRNGRPVLVTDYSAGSAHAPSYRQSFGKRTLEDRDRDLMVRWECEHGRRARGVSYGADVYGATAGPQLKPDPVDVVWSLSRDADVLDAGGFETWASDLGYDTDSRKAEAIYRQCLDLALALRAALGEDGLTKLREAGQDY